MAVIAASPSVSPVTALLRSWTLSSTGITTAIGRSTTATTTLGEMAGQGSPHVSFGSRNWLNSTLRATSVKSVVSRRRDSRRPGITSERPTTARLLCVRARVCVRTREHKSYENRRSYYAGMHSHSSIGKKHIIIIPDARRDLRIHAPTISPVCQLSTRRHLTSITLFECDLMLQSVLLLIFSLLNRRRENASKAFCNIKWPIVS